MLELKIYGPYTRDDGRQVVILYNGASRQTVSYPKYLMEQSLGRKLAKDEVVHHINGDPTDHSPGNLQVLTRSEHAKNHVVPAEIIKLSCVRCGKTFERLAREERWNRKQGKVGPFCSKRCAGIYGTDVQNGRVPQLERGTRLKP